MLNRFPSFGRAVGSALAALAISLPAGHRVAAAQPPPAPETIAALEAKPLYTFTESEVDRYLPLAHAAHPSLRERIVHLARKNLGQPYELYLLGEMPFETHDPQPLYSLGKSDCLVFLEHTYAMALTSDWSGFMRLLQRIRYRDGHLGVVTRNHYTEADWNPSNRWLVRDLTAELAGDRAVSFTQQIDRSAFFRTRYKLEVALPVQEHRDLYLPFADIALAAPHLRDGDAVNVIRGVVKPGDPLTAIFGGSAWVGHVGLVAHGPDGTLHLIHSIKPAVREEPLGEFIARETADHAARDAAGKPRLLGFKFLRLQDDPWAELRKLDGAAAPRVVLPEGSPGRPGAVAPQP